MCVRGCVRQKSTHLYKNQHTQLPVPRKLTKTCQTDPSYHEWVAVIQCNPRLYRIPLSMSRRRHIKYRKQRSEVRSDMYAFFCFSDRRHDAVYDQQCTRDMVYVVKHGRLPPGSKAEWFLNKQRLRGSSVAEPLPTGLTEATSDCPVCRLIQQLISRRDKCTAQYHGLHAFYSNQEFEKRNEVAMHDHANTSRHGRCICDGVSVAPKDTVRSAAVHNHRLQPGCRGLVLYLAKHMSTPVKEGNNGFKGYFIAYYPEDAFDVNQYQAEAGYAGSSKDHFFTGAPAGGNLTVRERWCGCDKCIQSPTLWSDDCQWKTIVGSVRHHQIRPARPNRVLTVDRAGAPLEERVHTFYRPTKRALERVWVARVHEDDPSGRPYFLLRVIQAPWQLGEDSLINGNRYDKGWFVCKIHWFDWVEECRNGDHVYKLLSRPRTGEILSCNVIVYRPIISFDSYSGGKYMLSRINHERIMRFGDLDYNS